MKMKIDRITLFQVSMPLVSPFETSFGKINSRDCIIIQVEAEGEVGVGECVADKDPGYGYETTQTAWHILADFIIPSVLGKVIENASMYQELVGGIRGHLMAKAGLEMALWDLWGKLQGKSLASLLGGHKQSVKVGVSIGIQNDHTELVKVIDQYLQAGYKRVKLKIRPGRDIEDAQLARKVFPDLQLQVDANSAYTLDSAQTLLPLDDLNLLMIEQPLYEDDLWDHHKLQEQFKTPICLDESILSSRHARYAIEMGSCRVINIKAGRVGGLSEAIAIHDLCLKHGIPNWCGGMLETGIGRASNLALATLENFIFPGDISATNRYYIEDITNEVFELNPDSTINVPQGNGLGVTINQAKLQKYSKTKVVYEK